MLLDIRGAGSISALASKKAPFPWHRRLRRQSRRSTPGCRPGAARRHDRRCGIRVAQVHTSTGRIPVHQSLDKAPQHLSRELRARIQRLTGQLELTCAAPRPSESASEAIVGRLHEEGAGLIVDVPEAHHDAVGSGVEEGGPKEPIGDSDRERSRGVLRLGHWPPLWCSRISQSPL